MIMRQFADRILRRSVAGSIVLILMCFQACSSLELIVSTDNMPTRIDNRLSHGSVATIAVNPSYSPNAVYQELLLESSEMSFVDIDDNGFPDLLYAIQNYKDRKGARHNLVAYILNPTAPSSATRSWYPSAA